MCICNMYIPKGAQPAAVSGVLVLFGQDDFAAVCGRRCFTCRERVKAETTQPLGPHLVSGPHATNILNHASCTRHAHASFSLCVCVCVCCTARTACINICPRTCTCALAPLYIYIYILYMYLYIYIYI